MKTVRKLVALALAVMLALSLACTAPAAGTLSQSVQKSAQYLLSAVPDPQVGGVGGEWAVLGLARSGASVPDSYFSTYYRNVERYVRECRGVLHERKYTEYSRVIIALTAIGKDPTNVAGYNLLTPLGDYDQTVWQGVNGPMWALIALDCGGYDMPKNTQAKTQATRQMYVDLILGAQLSDGGWTIGGNEADPDLTAMALQALAPYRGQKAVRSAVNDGIACLSKLQGSTGGYESWGTANSESAAQVVVALTTLDIPLDDSRFVKGGKTVLDALLTYQNADGSFRPGAGITRAEFAKLAVSFFEYEGIKAENGFKDVAEGSWYARYVAAAAELGLVNGYEGGIFRPEAGITRAEASAIINRTLGRAPVGTGLLPEREMNTWPDNPADAWYYAHMQEATNSHDYRWLGDIEQWTAKLTDPDWDKLQY